MVNEKGVLLSGAPGSGKSTLLTCLRELGYSGVDEPARQILAEQRPIGGAGVPEGNPSLFVDLLLSRSISQYQAAAVAGSLLFFDRGIPDNIAYASLFNLEFERGWKATETFQYNRLVFFTPNWEAIYSHDEERKMSFQDASKMGDHLREIYQKAGHTVVDLPLDSPKERARFVLNALPEQLVL